MATEVKRWACDFCKTKTYQSKASAVRHEKQCFANPINKACRTCKNYVEDYETVYTNYHDGNPGSEDYDIKIVYCESYSQQFYHGKDHIPLNYNCPRYEEGTDNFKG